MEMLVTLPSTEVQEKTGQRLLECKGEDWTQWGTKQCRAKRSARRPAHHPPGRTRNSRSLTLNPAHRTGPSHLPWPGRETSRGGLGGDATPGGEARERSCPPEVWTALASKRAAGKAGAEEGVRCRGGKCRTGLQRPGWRMRGGHLKIPRDPD